MEIDKARIDKQGILSMWRGGTWKQQHCAKRHDHLCGDLCALFQVAKGGELGLGAARDLAPEATNPQFLLLCTGTAILMDIEDLRSTEPDQPRLLDDDHPVPDDAVSDGVTP
jgi:hypothetical protein